MNFMRHFAFLLTALCIQILSVRADDFTKTRQVLLPDGSPAIGVPVLVRKSAMGRVQWADLWLRTDEKGMVRIEGFGSNISMGGFVMVDAPGCALSFWTQPFQERKPLQLKTDVPLRGKVTDKQGKPITGATVFTRQGEANSGVSSIPWALNHADQKWKLPQLVAQTGHDGSFELRSVTSDEAYDWRLNIVTQIPREGQIWSGETSVNVIAATLLPSKDIRIIAEPPVSIRGQVINAATRKPLAGTTVRLRVRHNWVEAPAPIMTSKDGQFDFEASPLADSWEIHAENKQFTVLTAKLLKSELPLQARQKLNLYLALRPQTKIQGRVIDAETNRPPLVQPIVVAFPLHATSKQGPFTIVEQAAAASTQPDGSFEILLGTGHHQLEANTILPLMYGCMVSAAPDSPYKQQGIQKLSIGESGRKNVRVVLHKKPGILLRLEWPPAPQRYDNGMPISLEWRLVGGKSKDIGSSNLLFIPTPKWVETVEVRLMNFSKELLPWTRLVADGKKWPVSLQVPEPPTESRVATGLSNEKSISTGRRTFHAPPPISDDTLALFAPK